MVRTHCIAELKPLFAAAVAIVSVVDADVAMSAHASEMDRDQTSPTQVGEAPSVNMRAYSMIPTMLTQPVPHLLDVVEWLGSGITRFARGGSALGRGGETCVVLLQS